MIPALFSCIVAFVLLSLVDVSHPLLVGPFTSFHNFDFSFGGALFSGAIDVFFLSGRSAYNPVLWTMKIELIGSFLVYLLCVNRFTIRSRLIPLAVLFILAALVATKVIEHRLGLGLMCFVGGYLIRIYGIHISSTKATFIMIIGLYLAGAHNDSYSYRLIEVILGKYTYALCNFMSGFFIVYAVIFGAKINDVFSRRLPVFMGRVSFSVYLIHFLIIATLGVYLFGILFDFFGSFEIAAILASCITIVFTYACSVPYYRYVDSTGMGLSAKFSKTIIGRLGLLSNKSIRSTGR